MKSKNYMVLFALASLLGSRAAVVIDPCWQVYSKICYTEGSAIYNGPLIPYGVPCISETWYITCNITGRECYELRKIGTILPSGYTVCRHQLQQYFVIVTKVLSYCIPKSGCVNSIPVTEGHIVFCADDQLDNASEECVPAS